jgi:hypothetical protein
MYIEALGLSVVFMYTLNSLSPSNSVEGQNAKTSPLYTEEQGPSAPPPTSATHYKVYLIPGIL